MRDLLISGVLLTSLLYALSHPWAGVAVWTLVSLLNPHRFAWGFAYDWPFAACAAAVTFIALIVSKDPKRLPTSGPAITLILLSVWICITTVAAFFPEESTYMLTRVLKIYLMTIVAMSVITTEKHIRVLVWIITMSVALIAAKGGLFTLLTGGNYLVWGPPSSFIEENNAFAVAAIMIVPLLIFLVSQARNKWVKWALIAAIPLSLMSSLGSHSRGALLALSAMLIFLVLKSKRKFLVFFLILAALPFVISFLPEEWFSRMSTIGTYETDGSAMGRINAWQMAWHLGLDRITGGGFAIANPFVFGLYAPDPTDHKAAHSIYFQMLGEHGFIGLFLFLALWIQTWLFAGWVARKAKNDAEYAWMEILSRMIQVSLIGYLVGAAFLSLAYWDMPYYQMVVVVAMRRLLKERDASTARAARFGIGARRTGMVAAGAS